MKKCVLIITVFAPVFLSPAVKRIRNSPAGASSCGYQIPLATPFDNDAETDAVREVAEEFRNNVAYLEIGHEAGWTSSADINSRIKKITDKPDALGLPHPVRVPPMETWSRRPG